MIYVRVEHRPSDDPRATRLLAEAKLLPSRRGEAWWAVFRVDGRPWRTARVPNELLGGAGVLVNPWLLLKAALTRAWVFYTEDQQRTWRNQLKEEVNRANDPQ